MTATKFNPTEMSHVLSCLGSDMTLRINKCGNLDIMHKKSDGVHYVLYKRGSYYFIRRRFTSADGVEMGHKIGKYYRSIWETMQAFNEYRAKYESHLYQVMQYEA